MNKTFEELLEEAVEIPEELIEQAKQLTQGIQVDLEEPIEGEVILE